MNIYKYILFVYKEYIQEDWNVVDKIGQIILKPFWFIRSFLMWIYSIICFPLVLLHMKINKILKELDLDIYDLFNIILFYKIEK